MVITIQDLSYSSRIIEMAKVINPDLYIISRARFIQEVESLHLHGANEVIPEEYETSIELFTRTLSQYFVPENDIEKIIASIRSEGYKMFRSISFQPMLMKDLKELVPDFKMHTFRIEKDSSVENKMISEIEFRKRYGITIIAIH